MCISPSLLGIPIYLLKGPLGAIGREEEEDISGRDGEIGGGEEEEDMRRCSHGRHEQR